MKTAEKNYLKQKWSIAGFLLSQQIEVKMFPNYLEFILNGKLCHTEIMKRGTKLKAFDSRAKINIRVWNLEDFLQLYSLEMQ